MYICVLLYIHFTPEPYPFGSIIFLTNDKVNVNLEAHQYIMQRNWKVVSCKGYNL
jgi:hypothetical protein